VQDQVIALHYVPSELQLADFSTKAQTWAQHSFFFFKLSVVDPPWVWEGGGGVLELYLYIVVSLIIRVFPAYFTPIHVLYIVAFGPSGIQVAIPNTYLTFLLAIVHRPFDLELCPCWR
jgi:hypothetical protein